MFSAIFGSMIQSGRAAVFALHGHRPSWSRCPGSGASSCPPSSWPSWRSSPTWWCRTRPRTPGSSDFDPQDATSGDTEKITLGLRRQEGLHQPASPLTIAVAEFCTGLVRKGFEQWFPRYMQEAQHLELDEPGLPERRHGRGRWPASPARSSPATCPTGCSGHRRPPVAFIGYALQIVCLGVIWRAPSLNAIIVGVHRQLARHLDGALDALGHRLDGLRRQARRGDRGRACSTACSTWAARSSASGMGCCSTASAGARGARA